MASATNIPTSPGSRAPRRSRLGRHADAAGMFERYGRAARIAADPGQGLLLGRARRHRRRPGAAGDGLARAGGRQRRPVLRPARARAARPDAAAAGGGRAGGRRRARRLRRPPARRGDPLSRHDRPARATRPCSSAPSPSTLDNDRERALAGEFGRQIGRLDIGVWAAREARTNGADLLCARGLPRSADPGRLSPALGLRPRHHAPGKLVRAHRGQLGRRARPDAADARHRAAGGEPARRALCASDG